MSAAKKILKSLFFTLGSFLKSLHLDFPLWLYNRKCLSGITLYHVRGGPAPLASLHCTFSDPSSVYNWSFSPFTPTCKRIRRFWNHRFATLHELTFGNKHVLFVYWNEAGTERLFSQNACTDACFTKNS